MSEREVKIGLIGCGIIGPAHLAAWGSTPGAKISAICDLDESKAKTYADKYGAIAYTDLAKMLKEADIDALDICTPSGFHSTQGLMAIEADKHVLIEKPIDIDINKADKLITAAEAKGLIIACIFQNRIGAEIIRAKQLIDEGMLGTIISGSTYMKWWRGQDYYDSGEWRGTWALDGGVFSNQAIHAIDQLCWLCGPVKEVKYCHIDTVMHEIEAEDFGVAMLNFENGAYGVVEATTCCYPGAGMKTEIFGTKGSAVFEGPKVTLFEVQGEKIDLSSEDKETSDGRSNPLAISTDGLAVQIANFADCIRNGGEPLVGARSARVAIDALTKMYNKAGITKLGI